MAARTLSSSLIVRLIDQVSAPARKIGGALLGLNNAAQGGFAGRLGAAIERNNQALDTARSRLFDAAAGGFVLKRAFDATAGSAMSLEDKMADIAKVSGMNTAELKEFEGVVRNLARNEIPLAVEELADLAANASQSGIANEDLDEFTRMVAKSAVAWDMAGGLTGESLAKIKTALGLTIEETRSYADAINYLSDNTASSAADLVEFSRRVAADGKVAGFSNEEVLALGATMISMGAQADVAATSLRNVGRMLSRGEFGAKKAQLDAFKQLGLDVEKVAEAMQVDASGTLLEVLEQINKAAPHQKLALMSGVFGDEARALMPLLTQLDQTRSAIEGVADETNYLGSVQREFETRSKTGSYAIQRFKNQLRDVAIVIGQALLPAMKAALDVIAPYIIAVSDLAAEHPKLVAGVFAAAAAIVAFKTATAGLTFLGLLGRGGALSMLSIGFNTVGKAVLSANAAATNAVGLQSALAAMSGGKFGNFAKIGVAIRGMAMAVPGVTALGSALSAVGAAIGAVSLPIAIGVAAAVAAIAAAGVAIWKYWDRISSIVTGVAQAFGEVLAPAIEPLKPTLNWLADVGGKIGEGLNSAWEAVNKFFGDLFTQEVLTEDEKSQMRQAGHDAVMNMLDGMKSMFASVIEWFGTWPGEILKAIGSIDISSLFTWRFPWDSQGQGGPSLGNATINGQVTDLPSPTGHVQPNHRALGGPAPANRPLIVGDGGEPELFTPRSSGHITPMSKLGGRSAQFGDVTIIIQDADDPRATAEAVSKELESLSRGAHSDSEAWD